MFRVRTRDLTPTFGSPLGAQLVDVYVHVPGAATTSTAASFPQRNYVIAPAGAWSRLLEVQGFGQRYIDPSGTTVGTITIRGNAISRFITFTVPKSALGTPTAGLGLHGRPHRPGRLQLRSGARLPAHAAGLPVRGLRAGQHRPAHCGVDPSTVPKAMDVFTPPGTAQSDELDYTVHNPVTIAPVVMP